MSQFPERTLAQAIVVVKAMCRGMGIVPISVELVERTPHEYNAWRKEAEKYLIARARKVQYKPETRNWSEEFLQ